MSNYVNKKGVMVEVSCGDFYFLTSPFGFFEMEKVAGVSAWRIFGFNFFERMDDKSLLFGVDWNGN